jgi:hypothetical protein
MNTARITVASPAELARWLPYAIAELVPVYYREPSGMSCLITQQELKGLLGSDNHEPLSQDWLGEYL